MADGVTSVVPSGMDASAISRRSIFQAGVSRLRYVVAAGRTCALNRLGPFACRHTHSSAISGGYLQCPVEARVLDMSNMLF